MPSSARSSVRNPLTLMAVFAGLAEVSATIALPRLTGEIQFIFVWFTIGFPFSIIIPFFIFLWFKPKNLYAPGDYRKDPAHLTDNTPPAPVAAEKKKAKPKKIKKKPDKDVKEFE